MAAAESLIAGVEAGGTKILCAVATSSGDVLAQARFATRTPDATFAEIAAFFAGQRASHGPIKAGGIASFGPLDLDPESSEYGCLTTTPKSGWSGADMRGRIANMIDAPVAIDTDVQCAALAELRNGAGIGLDRLCYVTIGTGIGVGYADRHRMDTDGSRPEAGHIRVPRAPGDEGFAGACPYHHECLEGLASGPAMAERWGVAAENLPDHHPGWDHQAHYVACLCINLTYSVRPDRIVLGGGVMERPGLHGRVRAQFDRMTAGYSLDRRSADSATFIAPPVLNEPSPGLVGALMLARTVRADDR